MKGFLSVLFVLIIVGIDPRMFGEATGSVIFALLIFSIVFFKKLKGFNFNDSVIFCCALLTVSSILHFFFSISKIFGSAETIILTLFDFWFAHIMLNYILEKKLKIKKDE